jgi:hypothetical protein
MRPGANVSGGVEDTKEAEAGGHDAFSIYEWESRPEPASIVCRLLRCARVMRPFPSSSWVKTKGYGWYQEAASWSFCRTH